MKSIVCISDTHGQHDKLIVPDGDILIVAGDITYTGSPFDVIQFNEWLGKLPHEDKIVVPGNHDHIFKSQKRVKELLPNATILIDQSATIQGLKIYGSPWTPRFGHWSFMADPQKMIEIWAKIPDDTDILVTHGPPYGILDMTKRGVRAGCPELMRRVEQVRPKLHVFGHIHEGHGSMLIMDTETKGLNSDKTATTKPIHCVNVSVLNEYYDQVFEPTLVYVEEK